jgi:protein TonB
MELKKNPSADLEKFKTLFLVISFILSLGVTALVFSYQSKTEDKQIFSSDNYAIEEEIVKITRQDIEPPQEEVKPEQQQVVEEIIIKENTEIITEVVEFDNSFDENDNVDLSETGYGEGDETIFVFAEHMPEFPGGLNALRSFIATNIKYPQKAQENRIQGTVFLRFEVTRNGKIGKIEITKGVNELLDNEAMRVVKTLPDFIPGSQNGKNVAVWYSLPISFQSAR